MLNPVYHIDLIADHDKDSQLDSFHVQSNKSNPKVQSLNIDLEIQDKVLNKIIDNEKVPDHTSSNKHHCKDKCSKVSTSLLQT